MSNDGAEHLPTWEIGVEEALLVRIPFANHFLEPIVREEKDATVRVERYDIEAGDHVILSNAESGVEWAAAKVEYTITCPAKDVSEFLSAVDAKHSVTQTTKNIVEILQPYYRDPVRKTDTVQIIGWTITQRFARADSKKQHQTNPEAALDNRDG